MSMSTPHVSQEVSGSQHAVHGTEVKPKEKDKGKKQEASAVTGAQVAAAAPTSTPQAGHASAPTPSAPLAATAAKSSPVDPLAFDDDGFTRINPDFFFYKVETEKQVGDTVTLERHRLRGILLARAMRPENERDREENAERGRLGQPPKSKGFFYVVQLTAPCTVFNHEKEPVQGKPGTIVWLDERYNMRGLRHLLPKVDGEGAILRFTEIGVKPSKKVDTSNGQKVWKIELYKKEHVATEESRMLLASPDIETMARQGDEFADNEESDVAPPEKREGTDESIPF